MWEQPTDLVEHPETLLLLLLLLHEEQVSLATQVGRTPLHLFRVDFIHTLHGALRSLHNTNNNNRTNTHSCAPHKVTSTKEVPPYAK